MVTGSECSLVELNARKLQWSHPKNPSIQDKLNNTKMLTTHDFWVLSELSLHFYPNVMQEETAGFVLPSAVGIIPSLVELKQKRSWKLVLANLKSSLCGSLLNTKATLQYQWIRKDLVTSVLYKINNVEPVRAIFQISIVVVILQRTIVMSTCTVLLDKWLFLKIKQCSQQKFYLVLECIKNCRSEVLFVALSCLDGQIVV